MVNPIIYAIKMYYQNRRKTHIQERKIAVAVMPVFDCLLVENYAKRWMRDMSKLNDMKEKCEILKTNFPEDASKISTRNIYQRVIKEYVVLHCLNTLSICVFTFLIFQPVSEIYRYTHMLKCHIFIKFFQLNLNGWIPKHTIELSPHQTNVDTA